MARRPLGRPVSAPAAAHRAHQGARLAQVTHHGDAAVHLHGRNLAAHQRAHAVPAGEQRIEHVPPHEPGSPGEEDLVAQATGVFTWIWPRSVSRVARSDSRSDAAVATTAVGS